MTYAKHPSIFLFRKMLRIVVYILREKFSRHESGIHQSVEGKKSDAKQMSGLPEFGIVNLKFPSEITASSMSSVSLMTLRPSNEYSSCKYSKLNSTLK